MSGTTNEFDEPGGNYPDRYDEKPIEPSQDDDRRGDGEATVQHGEATQDVQGGAVAPDAKAPEAASAGSPGTQDAPAMDMHSATNEDRVEGIVAQTRVDVGDAPEERIADVLRQRFSETGTDIGDDRIRALAAEIAQR
ncbi:hypothetical protein [Microbacterium lushaniae]|uniref:Uncharacterized protein n=1 Tax=Microbacterium lushaniae TaxID=2614639 RepID=A0A5J6L6Y0_9MICO|nr:hypothetical protein [Microbacterium lushaniae]QEW04168.1 hypothetical protein F6J85_14450 [Microbacterium lushaniae]